MVVEDSSSGAMIKLTGFELCYLEATDGRSVVLQGLVRSLGGRREETGCSERCRLEEKKPKNRWANHTVD